MSCFSFFFKLISAINLITAKPVGSNKIKADQQKQLNNSRPREIFDFTIFSRRTWITWTAEYVLCATDRMTDIDGVTASGALTNLH